MLTRDAPAVQRVGGLGIEHDRVEAERGRVAEQHAQVLVIVHPFADRDAAGLGEHGVERWQRPPIDRGDRAAV